MKHFKGTRNDELESLLRSGDAEIKSNSKFSGKNVMAVVVTAIGAFAAVVGVVAVVVGAKSFFGTNGIANLPVSNVMVQIDTPTSLSAVATALKFTVHDVYGEAKYGSLHPFIGHRYVAEPHKTVVFTAIGSKVLDPAYSIKWSIEGASGATDATVLYGHRAEVAFTDIGSHNIVVSAFDKHGIEIERFKSEVVSVYGTCDRFHLISFALLFNNIILISSTRAQKSQRRRPRLVLGRCSDYLENWHGGGQKALRK
jgi:hypothetical protein